MKKKSTEKETSTKQLNEHHSLNQNTIEHMPKEPLPQPKDYDEIEY